MKRDHRLFLSLSQILEEKNNHSMSNIYNSRRIFVGLLLLLFTCWWAMSFAGRVFLNESMSQQKMLNEKTKTHLFLINLCDYRLLFFCRSVLLHLHFVPAQPLRSSSGGAQTGRATPDHPLYTMLPSSPSSSSLSFSSSLRMNHQVCVCVYRLTYTLRRDTRGGGGDSLGLLEHLVDL